MQTYVCDHTYSVVSCSRGPNAQTYREWEKFDEIITNFLWEQQIPGAAVAIARLGKTVYQQGYGVAGCSRRVHPDSVFRIASISKPITAAVTLHVCKAANVSLDAPVFGKKGILKKYRAQDKRMKKVTIRHLLQHSAGWDRDKVGDAAFVRPQCVIQHHPDAEAYNHALLAYALRRKLQFTPGTWHAYSNLGYLALGQVVQEITGKSYGQVLKDFLQKLDINTIRIGQRWRTEWNESEVEYFNNKDPAVVESLYPGEGLVLPQYGGMAMPSSASYGGLVADSASLLQFVHCMELAVNAARKQDPSFQDVSSETERKRDGLIPSLDEVDESLSDQFKDRGTACREEGEKPATISLLSPQQVRESMARPAYEKSSADWYGLGWDVQDNGSTWGHTGGMEGTCGTLYHHGHSGLSWVFLLNAWAQDCDLNGVIKSGLLMTALTERSESPIPGLRQVTGGFCAQVVKSAAAHGCGDAVKVVSENREQVILLNSTQEEAMEAVSELKHQGYTVTWISCMNHFCGSKAGKLKQRDGVRPKEDTSKHSFFLNNHSYKKYCFIFTKTDSLPSDCIVLFDMSLKQLETAFCSYKYNGYFVTFLDSYCENSALRFTAVLSSDHSFMTQNPAFCVSSLPLTPISSHAPAVEHSPSSNQSSSLPPSTLFSLCRTSKSCLLPPTSNSAASMNGPCCTAKSDVCLSQRASDYVKSVKSLVESHTILVQTVTEVDEELWVSVLVKPKVQTHSIESLNERADSCAQAILKHRKERKRKSCQTKTEHEKVEISARRYALRKTAAQYSNTDSIARYSTSSEISSTFQKSSQNHTQELLTYTASQSYKKPSAESSATPAAPPTTKVSWSRKPADTKLDTVYWLQISPESFLTELQRQIQRGRSLLYAKFYNASGKPYVTALWARPDSAAISGSVGSNLPRTKSKVSERAGHSFSPHATLASTSTSRYHRTALSKYGLLPELAEAASKNILLQCLSEYMEEDGSVYYSALWFA